MLNMRFGLQGVRDEFGRPYVTFHRGTVYDSKQKDLAEAVESDIKARFPTTTEFHLRSYEVYTDEHGVYNIIVRISGDD